MSGGELVACRSIRVGTSEMTEVIADYVRQTYWLEIWPRTAERVLKGVPTSEPGKRC